MNPRTLQREDKSFVPMLYMAMELSNLNWKLLFGDGARHCQLSIAAGAFEFERSGVEVAGAVWLAGASTWC